MWKLFTDKQLSSSIKPAKMCKVTCNDSLFCWLHSTSELVILWKKCHLHATKLRSKKLSTKFMHSYVLQILGNLFSALLTSGGTFSTPSLQAVGPSHADCYSQILLREPQGKSQLCRPRSQLCRPCPRRAGGSSCTSLTSFALLRQHEEVVLSRRSSPRTVTNNKVLYAMSQNSYFDTVDTQWTTFFCSWPMSKPRHLLTLGFQQLTGHILRGNKINEQNKCLVKCKDFL